MFKTLETAEYIGEHKNKVIDFTNKVNNLIKLKLGSNPDVDNFIKEANKRALSHDNDKLNKYRTLELYSKRDEFENEEERKEYKKSHKLSSTHHVDYFVERNLQMSLNDIYEMMADIYSSTLLRKKKAYDELLEEQETGGFNKFYLEMILNTYGEVNYNFKIDAYRKYPNMNKTYNFVDLVRDVLIKKQKLPPFIQNKK